MKRLRLFALLIFISVFSPLKAEPLSVYTDEWPPYNFHQDGQLTGISTEIIKATLKNAELAYTIQSLPWKRALLTTRSTPFSMMYTVARTQERENYFKWVGPIIEGHVYMYKLKENDKIKIKAIADLKRYSVAVLRGGAVEAHLLSQGFTSKDFVRVTYSEQLIPMLFANRIDLIPGDKFDLAFQVAQSGREATNIEKAFLLYKRDYYVALNLETPDELVEQLQTSLDKIIQSGERELIIRRYQP